MSMMKITSAATMYWPMESAANAARLTARSAEIFARTRALAASK